MDKKSMRPESLMMTYGYKPELSEGAIKCPIFQTSTFVFKTAEEGKGFFEVAYGKRKANPNEEMGLIYSRINNPDLQILEERLSLWDGAEQAAVFESGMSAITTVLLEFLSPGGLLLYNSPLYGGTDHFINAFLPKWGINKMKFSPNDSYEQIVEKIKQSGMADKLEMVYVETPANPTNALTDIDLCVKIAKEFSTPDKKVHVVCDNTYMGPLWQHPLKHGVDLVMYSATKYIGGHSDLIAGAVLGNAQNIKRIKSLRTSLGNMASPLTCWLLMRSLETLKMRMEKHLENAQKVADYLNQHPKVEKVYYLGLLTEAENPRQYAIYKNQCLSPGAMISFDVKGGEKEAFKFLNNLKLMKLAVSLGSTESLAEHPYTMTHSDVNEDEKNTNALTEKLIRLSIGVEHYEDIIWDIEQALETV